MEDEQKAMGAVNDSILYYGKVILSVKEHSDIFSKVVFSSQKEYGKSFYDILRESNYDFYKIDPCIFSPAKLVVNDLSTGKTYSYGTLNPEIVLKSFGVQKT